MKVLNLGKDLNLCNLLFDCHCESKWNFEGGKKLKAKSTEREPRAQNLKRNLLIALFFQQILSYK